MADSFGGGLGNPPLKCTLTTAVSQGECPSVATSILFTEVNQPITTHVDFLSYSLLIIALINLGLVL